MLYLSANERGRLNDRKRQRFFDAYYCPNEDMIIQADPGVPERDLPKMPWPNNLPGHSIRGLNQPTGQPAKTPPLAAHSMDLSRTLPLAYAVTHPAPSGMRDWHVREGVSIIAS